MKRHIYEALLKWKDEPDRKVLLLRGARQVGKTYIVREFGREFRYLLEVNFEQDRQICTFFNRDLNVQRIIADLSAYYKIQVIEGETLLFLDEVQACRKAIEALRFFYEQKPGLHVIAAGSLLDFAIEDIPSFGVGRIRSIFMYPMSFDEFLQALGEEALIEIKRQSSAGNPLREPFHMKLNTLLIRFLIIGGMPEAVKKYVNNQELLTIQQVLEDLIVSLRDDFAKYKKRIPALRIREVFESITRQTGGKFILSKAIEGIHTNQIKEALELLFMAGLAYPVYHTSARGLPLGSQMNVKKFKVLLFDTGIFQRILKLQISDLLLADKLPLINKGNIAEIFAGLEFIKYHPVYEKPQLFYWHREIRGSHAEIDYLLVKNGVIYPLEVKSGTTGKMQSMKIFLEERKSGQGIRISMENFSKFGNIEVIPLYAISNILD